MIYFKKLSLLIVVLSIAIFTTSCSSSDSPKTNTVPTIDLTDILNSKWNVTSGSDNITSVEFNTSGNYLLVGKLNGSTTSNNNYFGYYTKDNDNTVTLKDVSANVVFQTLENNVLTFVLTQNGQTYNLKATKAAEMTASTNTALLCKSWVFTGLTKNGSAATQAETKEYENEVVMFSRANTYVTTYLNNFASIANMKWKWVNATENSIYYTWDSSGDLNNVANLGLQNIAVTNNKLTITETIITTTRGIEPGEIETVWVWSYKPL